MIYKYGKKFDGAPYHQSFWPTQWVAIMLSIATNSNWHCNTSEPFLYMQYKYLTINWILSEDFSTKAAEDIDGRLEHIHEQPGREEGSCKQKYINEIVLGVREGKVERCIEEM